MKNISIQKINLEKIEKIIFALFLLSIPIQTRLTFITPQTYQNGTFNEYTTFFLYLSDILFIITLSIFFVNIVIKYKSLTKIGNFSIKKIIYRLFHTYPRIIPTFTLLVTLITWSFVSILWSKYRGIAFYQSLKFIEFGLIFLYCYYRLQWFGLNRLISIIFMAGFLQSIIGITQYYLQRSLGLKILMESTLSPDTPNVAKIVVGGERMIRAYGTFPHPNIFSGFLLLSIFCGIWLLFSYKLLKPYKIVSRETILYALLITGILCQLTALIFTYSRSSWLAEILTLSVFVYLIAKLKLFHACPSELTIAEKGLTQSNSSKLFHMKQFQILRRRMKQFIHPIFSGTKVILMVALLIPFILIIIGNWKEVSNRSDITDIKYQESTNNRIIYNNIAVNIIKKYPLTGIGAKNFTTRMQEFNTNKLELWQFQPAHNIYLLIASELGIVGLTLFILFIYLIIKTSVTSFISTKASAKQALFFMSNIAITADDPDGNHKIVSRETILLKFGLTSILIGFLFIGLFDHYFWTLQQGQLTFWLLLGAITSFKD